jgi:glycosidase
MRRRPLSALLLALSLSSCRPPPDAPLPPDAPTNVVAVAGVRAAMVSWSAPGQASSRAPITYTVVASPGGSSVTTSALEVTFPGLANGATYTFTVTAANRFGASEPSAPSAPITTPDVPGAPEGVVAVPGDGSAEVSWVPGADGGSPITSFTVVASPGGATATSTGAPARVSGLTNGGTYTFTVVATSAVGTGPASASSAPVMPSGIAFDLADVPVGQTASALDPSWKRGPFMHVFVRAYRDSNGDGEGDLAGITEKLDYLKDLGIRGILLLPIHPNQDRDSGYLTTNFRDVAPDYGSLQDLDELIAQAHARGIGILMDEVLQYSGAAHPGFVSASASLESEWRDWYVWSPVDPGLGRWWWETPTGWYYGFFGQHNVAFNWKNPDVRAYHRNTLRYWLNRGVDGFRLDAVRVLVENGGWQIADQPETFEALRELRDVVKGYDNRLMLCEAPDVSGQFVPPPPDDWPPGLPPPPPISNDAYFSGMYAAADVCDGGFLFSGVFDGEPEGTPGLGQAVIVAAQYRDDYHLDAMEALVNDTMYAPVGSMGTLLSNHDRFTGKRLFSRLGGDTPAYRIAAATLLLMPGTPFIYYGDEIGMAETLLPTANPWSDHHQRGVMSWTGDGANAGFSDRPVLDGPAAILDPDDKYLAPVPNVARYNVATELADPGSLLHHYRALIELRRTHAALDRGLYNPIARDGAAWGFTRWHSDEALMVFFNYEPVEKTIGLWGGAWSAEPGMYEVLWAHGAPSSPVVEVAPGGSGFVTLAPQSAIVYRMAREAPPLLDLHAIGDFNGWTAGPEGRLEYLGGDRYQGVVALLQGPQYFKLSTPTWDSRVNVGGIGVATIELGASRALEQTWWRNWGIDANIHFEVPEDGTYQLDVVADDLYHPVLTVTRIAARP